MTAVNFTEFGFFDGVMKMNQENWAKNFFSHMPDGVISGIGDNLQAYGNSSGMKVIVKSGSCMIRGHKGTNTVEKELAIESANPTYPRIDLVVARAVYEAPGESYMCLDVLLGSPSASPGLPIVTQNAGVLWEIPIAQVAIGAGAETIASENVTDVRIYSSLPFALGGTGAKDRAGALSNIFGGSSLPIANGGTGQATVAAARNAFGLGNTTGAVPVANGGTGVTTLQAIRNVLGLGNTTGALPIANGGTQATDIATARTNLGLGNVATKAIGEALNQSCPFAGTSYTKTGLGNPAGGLVWVGPAEASRAAFYAADVHYYSHSAGQVTLYATTNPGTINVDFGWIG